jgi:hypothetical protein
MKGGRGQKRKPQLNFYSLGKNKSNSLEFGMVQAQIRRIESQVEKWEKRKFHALVRVQEKVRQQIIDHYIKRYSPVFCSLQSKSEV